jgi:hypothetical protein
MPARLRDCAMCRNRTPVPRSGFQRQDLAPDRFFASQGCPLLRKNKFSAASCEGDVIAKPASVTTSTSRRRIVRAMSGGGVASRQLCLPAGLVTLLCQIKRLPAPNRPTDVVFAEHNRCLRHDRKCVPHSG